MSLRIPSLAAAVLVAAALLACTSEPPAPQPVTPPLPSGEPAAAPTGQPGAEPAGGDPTEALPAGGDGEVDPASLVPGAQATDLAAAPVKLPADWKGTGVLAKRTDRVPRRAPAWAGVLAEVVERGGQRLLVVTGRVAKIKDVHLARSTAENRARDEARRWTGVDPQKEGALKEVWRDPRTGDTFALLELPVAADWVPGK
jgi:hypothetical protein